jgi:hypothetical protein
LLPNTPSRALQGAVALLAALYALLAANWILRAAASGEAETIATSGALGTLALVLAAGLWKLKRWARNFSKVAVAFLIVVGILGTFNPFAASDHSAGHGGEAPDWLMLAAIAGPLVAVGLWCYHLLDKHESEFR